jgi:hypothetical protein
MERIIRVVYNPQIAEGEITVQRHRDYYTNTDTLEQAITIARNEMLKLIAKIGGEIVSIEQI